MSQQKTDITKKPHSLSEYDPDKVAELEKCFKDPLYFIEKYVHVRHPTRGKVPFKLYDFQKTLIRSFIDHSRVVALISRQQGKCVEYGTLISVDGKPTAIGSLISMSYKQRLVAFLEKLLIKLAD